MRKLAAVLLSIAFAAPAAADQRDPRLDVLFDALVDAGSDTAPRVEAEIWRVWLEYADAGSAGLMQVGVLALQSGDLDTALSAFDVLVERAPDYAEAWNKRATVLYFLGEYEQSLVDVARTLELEPRHFGALSGAGLIFDALGQPEAALKAYREALAVHPTLAYPLVRIHQLEDEIAGDPL
ncbi:MAG: tetratricopeptide repeat protein [Alphaproteobacteria bacterium]